MLKAVVVSDLHVGGSVSLAHPDSTPDNDTSAPVRRALYDRWEHATSGPWHAPDVLVVNGDAVEGKNRKKGGFGLWTTDLLEQADHACELIQMWSAKQIFVVRGSGYHVEAGGSGLQIEEYLARKLKAEVYPNQEHVSDQRKLRSGWQWYIGLEDVTFHVSHKVGFSRVFHYRTTPLSRELLQARLNDMLRHEMGNRKVNVVIRSHAHYYLGVDHSGSAGFVTPCWKALDEFMLERGPMDISPDLGFLGFTVNGDTWTYEKNLFKLGDVQRAPLAVVGGNESADATSPSQYGLGGTSGID